MFTSVQAISYAWKSLCVICHQDPKSEGTDLEAVPENCCTNNVEITMHKFVRSKKTALTNLQWQE